MITHHSVSYRGKEARGRVSEAGGKCQVLNSNDRPMGFFPIQLENSAVNLL